MYDFLNNLLFAGALQGVLFSIFAFFSKKFKSRSTYFLGALILAFSLNLLQYYVSQTFLEDRGDLFTYFYIPYSSLFLVLYYFYVRTYLHPKTVFKKWEYLLYLPFGVSFLGATVEKILYALSDQESPEISMFFNYFRFAQDTFNFILSLALCVAAFMIIRRYDTADLHENQDISRKEGTKWLQAVTAVLFAMCLFWALPLYFELNFQFDRSLDYFYVLWVGLAVTIYLLGHMGLYRFGIIRDREKIHHAIKSAQNHNNFSGSDTGIKNSKSDVIKTFEEHVLRGKKFLDPKLSQEAIAEELGVTGSYLSRLINEELDTGFSNYINRLRVEEAKIYLLNPEFKEYSLVSIGLEAGFNSKSAFYSAFKKFTGMTPSEFKNKKTGLH